MTKKQKIIFQRYVTELFLAFPGCFELFTWFYIRSFFPEYKNYFAVRRSIRKNTIKLAV